MVSSGRAIEEAARLMMGFAHRTGLTSDRAPRRYLWTDSFAVCNFLSLAKATGDPRYRELALRLVDHVHHVLGRHRPDDPRAGWIGGFDEDEGEAHPTRGGLRIGKRLPERAPEQPFDTRLEWERDGQYFHYLTKWMHALDQVSRATGDVRFHVWGRELAERAHAAFTGADPSEDGRRMVWKMSIDLSRPLISTMGHHDPLDGWITIMQLQATASVLPGASSQPQLASQAADFASMCQGRNWVTADPLGLGELMVDAYRVEQLTAHGELADRRLLEMLIGAALEGLSHYARQTDLHQPATYRLAFRELGLAIGLSAVELMEREDGSDAAPADEGGPAPALQVLARFVPLGSAIAAFWLDPEHRRTRTWADHRDINEVMLATRLLPEGFLVLAGPP